MHSPARITRGTDMQHQNLNLLTLAIRQKFTCLPVHLPHNAEPDYIVVTLAEADIFAVAMTIADECASNNALIAYAVGDTMPLSSAVLNGLLHLPGNFLESVFEWQDAQLVCTRTTVDELIRGQVRTEKDVPSDAELRDACNELEANFGFSPAPDQKLSSLPPVNRWNRPIPPVRYKQKPERKPVPAGVILTYKNSCHRWSDAPIYFGEPSEKATATALSVAATKRPGQVLSAAELAIQQRYTDRCVASLLADSVEATDFADTDEPQTLAAKPCCFTAGATIHPTIFTADSINYTESGNLTQDAGLYGVAVLKSTLYTVLIGTEGASPPDAYGSGPVMTTMPPGDIAGLHPKDGTRVKKPHNTGDKVAFMPVPKNDETTLNRLFFTGNKPKHHKYSGHPLKGSMRKYVMLPPHSHLSRLPAAWRALAPASPTKDDIRTQAAGLRHGPPYP